RARSATRGRPCAQDPTCGAGRRRGDGGGGGTTRPPGDWLRLPDVARRGPDARDRADQVLDPVEELHRRSLCGSPRRGLGLLVLNVRLRRVKSGTCNPDGGWGVTRTRYGRGSLPDTR